MQYVLLIYSNKDVSDGWDHLSQDEQKAVLGEYGTIFQTPGVTGGAQLEPVTTATTVRVQDGRTLTTAETKEVLGGYFLLEADNIDKALEIAARIPAARMGGAIEVRPLVAM
jgi:hypothetical protein